MKDYKYLLFDLDNTLVDDNKNRKYAISRVLEYLNLDYDESMLDKFIKSDNEYWKMMANHEFDNIMYLSNSYPMPSMLPNPRFH